MDLDNKKTERDIEILKNGPICKYFRNPILNADINWFRNNNFEVIEMDSSKWTNKNAHKNLKAVLNFPDYYGENLNAFNDCLGDLYDKRYNGLILVFRHFDNFVKEDRKFAEAILDTISRESRLWLITGQKLISLIQSNDPDLNFSELGGVSPIWNSSEWFNTDRT